MAKKKPQPKNAKFKLWIFLFATLTLFGLGYLFKENINSVLFNKKKAKDNLTHISTAKKLELSPPKGFSVFGFDISKHQGKIEWETVKRYRFNGNDSVSFVFIKATEGVTRTDNSFKENWEQAKKYGFYRGAYHFYIPWRTGKSQAENFISMVDLEQGDLPPVIDFEKTGTRSKSYTIRELRSLSDVLRKKYKVMPIIYTNMKLYENYIKGSMDDHPLWIAFYTDNPHESHVESTPWIFWQYTQDAHIEGINHKVDINVFKGRKASFKKLLVK